jgi:hypothetical protein
LKTVSGWSLLFSFSFSSFFRCFHCFTWRFLCTVRTSRWIQLSMWGIHLSKLRLWRGCIQNVQSLVPWEDNNSLESVLFSATLSLNRSKSGFKIAGTLINYETKLRNLKSESTCLFGSNGDLWSVSFGSKLSVYFLSVIFLFTFMLLCVVCFRF